MKHLLLASLLLATVAGLPLVRAQPPESFLLESPLPRLDDDGPLSEPRHIRFGLTPTEVRGSMQGAPDVQLTPDIWVYWHFRSGIIGAEKFDTLIVSFGGGRVTRYRLAERKAVQALIDSLRPTQASAGPVAKK